MNVFIHPTAVIDDHCQIGDGSRVWHFTHIMSDCFIGRNCVLGQNVFVASGVTLGNGVKVQNNVSLYSGVICEDDVFLGPSVVFTNVLNPRSFIERKQEFKSTIIRKGASIGANATVVCGHTIGRYAFVGAGSVVTKDVPDYALFVGNPAIQTGWISEYGCKLNFDDQNEAICPQSGQRYRLIDGLVQRIIDE